MKHFEFKTRKDFETAASITQALSNGRHYCINAKDKEISIDNFRTTEKSF